MNRTDDAKQCCLPIPTQDDWGENVSRDLDWEASYTTYFGRSCEDLSAKFSAIPVGMVDDIRWMPRKPFAYYMNCLARYVLGGQVDPDNAAFLAGSFLNLVEEKVKEFPAEIRANLAVLREAVAYVAKNQELFDADMDIFGDFAEQGATIDRLFATIQDNRESGSSEI